MPNHDCTGCGFPCDCGGEFDCEQCSSCHEDYCRSPYGRDPLDDRDQIDEDEDLDQDYWGV